MSEVAMIVVRVLSAVVQFILVSFAALFAWLMSAWMVDDHWAAHASDSDWLLAAGTRVAVGLGIAVLVGGVLLVANRALVHWKLASPTARPIRKALWGASAVAAASIVGAVTFAIDRPFM